MSAELGLHTIALGEMKLEVGLHAGVRLKKYALLLCCPVLHIYLGPISAPMQFAAMLLLGAAVLLWCTKSHGGCRALHRMVSVWLFVEEDGGNVVNGL